MIDDDIGVTKFDKMRKVTFSTGLPRGTVATFNYEGQRWFAYPQKKMTDIETVQTRVLAVLGRVHTDLLAWINTHPDDANRVIHILGRTAGAKQLTEDKIKAWTMIEKGSDDEGSTATQEDQGQQAADDSGRDQ